ncbi:hypothetical protein RFI_10616 [Reticulomyxa filosa]|uniref:Uncharacterized protein n=1 Tax=Reticulomyxa filosa TaxID=46433 RepID=X6NMA7_RETFI|nr:hypothetical protein RFI_10616 [Reticulomyxa filosa]|eukprot:ETO26522.1 hypothetical protein RFI_10616 [Reticulomyxa filosa]
MMKINEENNKQNYQMLLFKQNAGLQLNMVKITTRFNFINYLCHNIVSLNMYAYVSIDDILFFGRYCYPNVVSKSLLSIQLKKTNDTISSTYMKIEVPVLDPSQLVMIFKNEIKFVIKYWTRTLKIKLVSIDYFDKIVTKHNRDFSVQKQIQTYKNQHHYCLFLFAF